MNLNKRLISDMKNRTPKKRLVQAGATALAFGVMLTTATFAVPASADDIDNNGSSGIVSNLYDVDGDTLQLASLGVTNVGFDSESAKWVLSLMATVDDYANVRTAPTEESEIVGKLRKGDMARVETLTDNGWYEISSGNLSGYIKADQCVTGEACKQLAEAVGYNGSTGITLAEEEAWNKALKAAAEEAARKKAAAAAASTTTTYTQRESYAATADEVTLLAAIVEKEDGGDGYEGQLAVASAIMNRVRSSRYPNNIYDVIDQKGQFVGGIAGLSKILSRGPSATSRRAAEAALAGADTVNGMTNFRAWYTGHSGTRIGEHVFF